MNALWRPLGWLLALFLVALPVVAVVQGWIGAGHWPLRTLRVQGAERVDEARLREVVRPYAQRGFFAVDLDAVRAAVAALPWVEHAEVRKHWPDVLEVRIRERVPVARWGRDRLLSVGGQPFPVLPGLPLPPGLPALDGPDARAGEVLALYRQARTLLPGVRGVALDARGSWSVQLADGVQVVLGRDQPQARLARFAPLLPRLRAQPGARPLVRADLRYTNGFSLLWGAPAAPAPAARPASPLPAPVAALPHPRLQPQGRT
ncbi:cell division protein FtsQ/DivIB [Thermomonas flagellata]|uniref:cell division protein FtsQ/DivIB n=1 Tax=Thermomonas flagellata TaxID=2888524 RepID=UPI001F04C49C|nr:cell division protein FtsQ/DivIB [Thermomonas flagellata]